MELYRKYRPETFDDVIGQSHVTKTLTSQITKNRIGHAYLFTGTRGTGKTTCAKIFARAINCLSPKNGSPCGECEVCKSLAKGGNLDIVEMDAASNNSVDNVRDIIDQIKYPPVNGRYKVYIIDEVHMLTPGAFNAFLKTLEEPPSYIVFVLATTEVHKLPQTVISRCMRFDFRLVAKDVIAERVKTVYDKERISYEEDVPALIAEAGEGSVRDALSIADRCAQYEGKVTYNDVADILGVTKKDEIYNLFDAVATGNVGETLKRVEVIAKQGKIMSVVAKDFISFTKDVLLAKTAGIDSVGGSAEHKNQISIRSSRTDVNTLVAIIKIFSSVDADLRYSLSPVVTFEMTAVKAARLYDADYDALEQRVARLEKNGVGNPDAHYPSLSEIKEDIKSQTAKPTNTFKPMDAFGIWGRLTTYFRNNENIGLYTTAGEQNDIKIENGKLVIYADENGFELLSSTAGREAIKRGLEYDGTNMGFDVLRRAPSINMDKEIERVRKLAGSATVRVLKR